MKGAPSSGLLVATAGLAGWLLAALAVVDRTDHAVVLWVLVIVGPTWAYAFCAASSEDDFPEDASRRRATWLRLLPWTIIAAPVVPLTLPLLVQFFRDSRADRGRTWLGSGRSRPGEGTQEQWR